MNIEVWDLVWVTLWAIGIGANMVKDVKKGSGYFSTILSAGISFLIVYKAGMFL